MGGSDRRRNPSRHQHGATLVEYALLLVAFVVGSLAAVQALEQNATDEVANQADCIETRPPPPSCQIAAITTTSSTIAPTSVTPPPSGTGPTTSTTTTTTTTTTPPASTASYVGGSLIATGVPPFVATAEAVVRVVDLSTSNPVPGALVDGVFTIAQPGPPQPFPLSCVTDAAGECQLLFNVPFTDVTEVILSIASINAVPPVSAVPGDVSYTNP